MAEGASQAKVDADGDIKVNEGDAKLDSTISDLVSKIVKANLQDWDTLIGKRDANSMKKESSQPVWKVKDRSKLNSRLRAKFIAKIADQYNKSINNSKNNDDGENELKLIEPIDKTELLECLSIRKDCQLSECKNKEYCYDIKVVDSEGIDNPRVKLVPNTIAGNFSIETKNGKYYYETVILNDKLFKNDGINIGYITDDHSFRKGVGETPHSFAWNYTKGLKLNEKRDYGWKWKRNDVIGCKIDLKYKYIEFYINGKSCGKAFTNLNVGNNIIPGITLSRTEAVNVYLTKNKLKHLPKDCECMSFDSIELQKNINIAGNLLASYKDGAIVLDSEGGLPTATINLNKKLDNKKAYYYEILLNSNGVMQVGFVDSKKFKAKEQDGEGVGDDSYSWAFDGFRANKWGKNLQYFKNDTKIKNNDIIGCLMDLDNKLIKYYLNGKELGTAFKDINMPNFKPAISLPYTTKQGDVVKLIFSKKNCKYFPKNVLPYDSGINFRVANICDKLKHYGYEQYKKDYKSCSDSIYLNNIAEFDNILKSAGKDKLVVVDFWATWCGPCVYIAPFLDKLAKKHINKAIVLKVDVDKFKTLSQRKGIRSMPTFQFYRNGNKVDEMSGANVNLLTSKIEKWTNSNNKPLASKILTLKDEDEYDEILKKNKNKILIIDWTASWCGPCKMIKPTLIEMSAKYTDKITFLQIDVDEFDDLTQENDVTAMPTFHFYKNGKRIKGMTISGANPVGIQKNIDKLLKD